MNNEKIVMIDGYKIKFCDFVYAPELDTYMFLDYISFENKKSKLLDLGTGTGILAIYFSEFFESIYAVDINPYAISCALQNAIRNKVHKIHFVLGDLFSEFPDNFTFDVILFNPPYLPRDGTFNNEKGDSARYLNTSWFGGETGAETISIFLKQAHSYLQKNGQIFFLISSLTNPPQIFKILMEENYHYKVLHREKTFFEELLLIKAW